MYVIKGIITLIFIVGTYISAVAQSQMNNLIPEDIWSIRIIQQSVMGFTDERNISAEEDIKRIVYYLKKYDYRDLGLEEIGGAYDDKKDWKYQIILNGWRDEVYIFGDRIFIGKSVFKLPPGMIREFDRIFRDL
ncbi:hypothetical protein ACFLU5_14535 [Bacteroidota bacterium]